ncbi:hypothetical protein VHUM_04225 [Vanrija humicola]|uniref:Oxo-4-hydroxy-4-carboxy-5-ureidoimidazoline decarboxylase domain-containing protein n=1 Tax=Vanrija humicola TaxID=5417 RepID=A0A7D8YYU1_VANHU|nr:hypothetical protein VHUM_04225 [Vanrija humicola]
MSLPPLAALRTREPLQAALSTLFEPTPALSDTLVPAVLARLDNPPASYAALVDLCADAASAWSYEQKAAFVAGHPMIGEVKGLSAHSAKEQGGVKPTPAVVLARLAHLNALYNGVFPGLRYITFVNGRTRAQIVPELEQAIGLPVSPVPLPDDFDTASPPLESDAVRALVRDPASDEWKTECDRAIADVWLIGHSRLKNMGLE